MCVLLNPEDDINETDIWSPRGIWPLDLLTSIVCIQLFSVVFLPTFAVLLSVITLSPVVVLCNGLADVNLISHGLLLSWITSVAAESRSLMCSLCTWTGTFFASRVNSPAGTCGIETLPEEIIDDNIVFKVVSAPFFLRLTPVGPDKCGEGISGIISPD
jgi:hypothetical protein